MRRLPVESVNFGVCFHAAVFVEVRFAFVVHVPNVAPEVVLRILLRIGMLVDAFLAEVLHYDLLSGEHCVADSAVLTIPEAVSALEIIIARLTGPEKEVRRQFNPITEVVVDWRKVLEEVKRLIVDRRIPQIIVDNIVLRLLDVELGEHHHVL